MLRDVFPCYRLRLQLGAKMRSVAKRMSAATFTMPLAAPLTPSTVLLTRDAARELDRRAIHDHGIPSAVLMESAGRCCALEALTLAASPASGDAAPTYSAKPVVVLAGPGNNGGDGFVVARTLDLLGVLPAGVRVVFVGREEQLQAGAADLVLNAKLWRAQGGDVTVAGAVPSSDQVALLAGASVIVDALFGTGLSRPITSPMADFIAAANAAAGVPIVSVDIPSGIDANDGAVLGVAIHAATTVTFAAAKAGLVPGAGPQHAGRVVVAEIGIPRRLVETIVCCRAGCDGILAVADGRCDTCSTPRSTL
jgi:NAD(P)H-hydrate epimerase